MNIGIKTGNVYQRNGRDLWKEGTNKHMETLLKLFDIHFHKHKNTKSCEQTVKIICESLV